MPIDARIPLGIDNNALFAPIQRGMEFAQNKKVQDQGMADDQRRLQALESQVKIGENNAAQEAEKFRLQSVATGALSLMPLIAAGDQEGIIRNVTNRREILMKAGSDTVETDEAIEMAMKGDLQSLAKSTQSAVQMGFATGVLQTQDGDYGSAIKGIGPDGNPAFFQINGNGDVREIEGYTPPNDEGITFTTSGGDVMRIGGSGGGGVSPKTANDATKELGELSDTLDILKEINTGFKPEFHTLEGRFDNWVTSAKALTGMDVSEEDKQKLIEFSTYKANVAQNQSAIIADLSGAAVSLSEAKRMNPFILAPDDDPIKAQAKLKNYTNNVEMAMARRNWLLYNSRKVNDANFQQFPLTSMRSIMITRSAEILDSLASNYPDMETKELQQMKREQLRVEFGI